MESKTKDNVNVALEALNCGIIDIKYFSAAKYYPTESKMQNKRAELAQEFIY